MSIEIDERIKEAHAEVESLRARIKSAAGPHAVEVEQLWLKYDAAKVSEAQAELELRVWAIGYFICEYGQRHLWKALWCRYAIDERIPDGWNTAEDYHEGDELAFLYGDDWRKDRDRLDT